ncbi:HAD-IA family hydrolase [Candidatus Woesearchaeota archaeon]|nr:HAD-IA family hydrolase [Candidatus Woesearchaeota archaeon]
MIRLIIFDMDGVLIDSADAWHSIFNSALEHFDGRRISREEFDRKVWARDFDITAKRYFSAKPEEVREYFTQIYKNFRKKLSAFPDIKSTLGKLRGKGLKLAVATNTHTENAVQMLSDSGIANFFDTVFGADKARNGKPEPDMLIKIMKELGLGKEESVFIGDTIYDKMAAEKAGIRFIGMRLGKGERIDSLAEILPMV